MHALRTAMIGCLVGIGLAVCALAPASAVSAAAPMDGTTAPVSDEPWSSPAYPVDCLQSGSQVSCTPQDPSDVEPQECFANVIVAGVAATVCTTFADHIPTIKTSGGKPMLVEYGCSLGDAVCVSFENAGRGMAISTTAMMFAVAYATRFDTSTALWTAAIGEWSFWQWAILGVLFCAMVWSVAVAIVSGDRSELVGAIIRSFIAFPASAVALWLTGHLLNTVDDLTWYVLGRDGIGGLLKTLQSVMWAGGRANYFFAFVMHGLLMIAMLLLLLVFSFRNIVLAALISIGPVAWMLFPLRGLGPQWVVRYVSAVIVLLLTGPLTVGFLALIVNGLSGLSTIWDPQAWPLVIGLILIAFAPFAVFGLFSFVGAVAADSLGSRMGSSASRGATHAAQSVSRVPSRIAALPAGGKAGPRPVAVAAGSSGRDPSTTSTSGRTTTSTATASRPATGPSTDTTSAPSTTSPPRPATPSPPPRPERTTP